MIRDKYTFTTVYSEEDAGWIGLCGQYPSLSTIAKERHLAQAEIFRMVAEVLEMEVNEINDTKDSTSKSDITFERGEADGRQDHPPAELTKSYLDGYKKGRDLTEKGFSVSNIPKEKLQQLGELEEGYDISAGGNFSEDKEE